MARIKTYDNDRSIASGDRVIGTDGATGTTKNFLLGNLREFSNTRRFIPALPAAAFITDYTITSISGSTERFVSSLTFRFAPVSSSLNVTVDPQVSFRSGGQRYAYGNTFAVLNESADQNVIVTFSDSTTDTVGPGEIQTFEFIGGASGASDRWTSEEAEGEITATTITNRNTNNEPNPVRFWTGTESEYQALVTAGTVRSDTLYYRRGFP